MKCRGSIACEALWSNEIRLIGDSLRLLTVSLATVLRPRFVFHDTFLSFHEHLSRPGQLVGQANCALDYRKLAWLNSVGTLLRLDEPTYTVGPYAERRARQ